MGTQTLTPLQQTAPDLRGPGIDALRGRAQDQLLHPFPEGKNGLRDEGLGFTNTVLYLR